jgi:hypothetical protein
MKPTAFRFRTRFSFILNLTLLLITLTATLQISAVPYGMAGCGLGSMVPAWKNDIGQIMAATTNASFSSQTFGITSGTSNCSTDGIVNKDMVQEIFVVYNHSALEHEMAIGRGERIESISKLLGCPFHAKELGELTKINFSDLIKESDNHNSKLLLSRLKTVISKDKILKYICVD